MRHTLKTITPLLATAAAAAAIAAAPIAAATPAVPASGGAATTPSDGPSTQQSCISLGGTQSACQSPGNAQVDDAPPQVDYFPYAGGGT